jgi:hypothetical protein
MANDANERWNPKEVEIVGVSQVPSSGNHPFTLRAKVVTLQGDMVIDGSLLYICQAVQSRGMKVLRVDGKPVLEEGD